MFFRLTRRVTSLINTGASRFERSFLCAQRKLISAEVKVLTVDAIGYQMLGEGFHAAGSQRTGFAREPRP
jgi:hypothetical protein